VEAGGASALLAVNEKAGVPLAQEQKELTPFQRIVIVKAAQKEQEEIEKQRSGSSGTRTSSTPSANPAGMPGGGTKTGQTVRYVNEGD
jgi:hypothetical protein